METHEGGEGPGTEIGQRPIVKFDNVTRGNGGNTFKLPGEQATPCAGRSARDRQRNAAIG